jgi:hypothetical protein
MKLENAPSKWSILVSCLFFFISVLTMKDYNIMWDARNHFFKGQAFANYFLRGWTNYNTLPISEDYARYYRDYISLTFPDPQFYSRISNNPQYRRSIYQDDTHTFDWLMARPATEHPVLSDIGSSISNIILYEKLGWLSDAQAYNIFSITLASFLVGIIFYWMSTSYGYIAAIVATLSLATSSLFWSESHFNIKDIPLLVFFSIAIWTFWKGITKERYVWVIFSALMTGAALGTKFNTVFLPFILIPWLFIQKKKLLHWWWLGILYPCIVFAVFFASWPQLWYKPIENFLSVISYYREVGVNIDYTPGFRTIFGISTYAIQWILYTTYPLILFLAGIGIVFSVINFIFFRDTLPILFVLWLFIPLVRASLPTTSIFGGVRHIIEYIPALSLLAGYGMHQIILHVKKRVRLVVVIVIFIAFIPYGITLWRLHPAENVYFNTFVGGLSGAKRMNLTGWGNTDGGIYTIALKWLNAHAEKGAHIAVGFSEVADFYLPDFREDLLADNKFSGYFMEGEYIVALTHNSELEHTYRLLYPETFLEPVFVWSIDGVGLIKIWKNSREFMKNDLKGLKETALYPTGIRKDNQVIWDLGNTESIVRMDSRYLTDLSCQEVENSYILLSQDGNSWNTLPETYPAAYIDSLGMQPNKNILTAFIAGQKARYINLYAEPGNACILNKTYLKVTVLR